MGQFYKSQKSNQYLTRLIFIFVLGGSENLWSGPHFPDNSKYAQWLYEDHTGIKCKEASSQEVNHLKCKFPVGDQDPFSDTDSMAEFLLLNPIAQAEDDRQTCLINQIRLLKDNPDVQAHALNEVCEKKDVNGFTKIEKLKEVEAKLDYFKSWLKKYIVVNDGSLRNIPQNEYKKNDQTIKWLRKVVGAYEIEEASLGDTDPLLSSPEIFSALRSRLSDSKVLGIKFVPAQTANSACGYLKKNIKRILDSQLKNLEPSHKNFHRALHSNNSWLKDYKFKETIWNSGARDQQLKKLPMPDDFMKASFCRMNARYGEGAKFRDGLNRIGTAGLVAGSILISSSVGLVRAAVTTAGRAEVSDLATLALRAITGTELAVVNTLGVVNAWEKCRPQVTVVSSEKSCQAMTNSEFKALYYNKVGENECALSIGLAIGTAGLSSLAIKSSLSGLSNDLEKTGMSRLLASETIFLDSSIGLASGARAEATTINEALRITEDAWSKTQRYMRAYVNKNFIGTDYQEFIKDNPEFTEAVFDRYVSHGVLPLGPDRALRGTSGLRVVDAPQLESLEAKGVPKSIIEHMTIDHHNSFGVSLPLGVNSTTKIIDLIGDPALSSQEFNKMFSKFASDNIGDAFGLARAVVRNADVIRKDPAMALRIKELARAEDFGIFGPNMDLKTNDTLAALLRQNDKTIPNLERTFMDRVSLGFGDKTKKSLDEMQTQLDRILFPKSAEDFAFTKDLATEFRQNVQVGIKRAESARIQVKSASGKTAPIFLADTTKLNAESQGQFEAWAVIPQMVRSDQMAGAQAIDRSFTIAGSGEAPTRTLIFSNFPGRGSSLFEKLQGQNKSFAEAYKNAEKAAIERRLSEGSLKGADELAAKERLRLIQSGQWTPQNRPDGNLIFGPTYMQLTEFENFVQTHTSLLGY